MDAAKGPSTSACGGGFTMEPPTCLSPTGSNDSVSNIISQTDDMDINSHNCSLPTTTEHTPQSNTGVPKVNKQPNKTFSQAVQHTEFPKKDQAVIFPSIEGIPIKDYIVGLGTIVGPKNVRFASRISNGRVCMFLASKDCVDNFMSIHAGITIGDIFINARRLITPASRIIISNVSPIIPHNIIENALKSNGVQVVSPVSYVGVGVGISEYTHVYSFRRQVFVAPDEKPIPTSIVVEFEGDGYRIFLSNEELKCFLCRSIGHISKTCPNQPKPAESCPDDPPNEATVNISSGENLSVTETRSQNSTGLKRLASKELDKTIEDSHQETDTNVSKLRKEPEVFKKPKKKKSMNVPDPPEIYDCIKYLFDERTFVLDFQSFKSFMMEVKGNSQPMEVARKYTNEITLLVKMMSEIYPFFETRRLKERCKRLVTSLEKNRSLSSSRESDASDLSDQSF